METHEVELIGPNGEVTRIHVSEDESIWDVATREGLDLPATCLQGWCITCAEVVEKGLYDQNESHRFYETDRKAGFTLLCSAKPRSPMRIRTHYNEEMKRHRQKHGLPHPRG